MFSIDWEKVIARGIDRAKVSIENIYFHFEDEITNHKLKTSSCDGKEKFTIGV